MPVRKISELVGAGEPGSMLVVDPGGTCGVVWWRPWDWDVFSCPLDELPHIDRPAAIVAAESYHLQASHARQQAGSDMPAAQGIGMLRQLVAPRDGALYLIPPSAKRAGHAALDDAGKAAYARAKNPHQRDAVDLAGFVLRELRRKA